MHLSKGKLDKDLLTHLKRRGHKVLNMRYRLTLNPTQQKLTTNLELSAESAGAALGRSFSIFSGPRMELSLAYFTASQRRTVNGRGGMPSQGAGKPSLFPFCVLNLHWLQVSMPRRI